MARVPKTVITDDITGEIIDDHETIRWGVDGTTYELDTTPDRAAEFRAHLAGYLQVSRTVSATGRPYSRTVIAPTGRAASRIRDWAAAEGIAVPARGRIPTAVREAFDAAHP
ncbi:histone-like nucleoid-structuring protein Lsr2 [Gordonia aichiensis]|uniref:histone-like nucleoid-structuring protein Lsr2 n=1 Tax=Gordonia aichiensis TaxID=36820 RepID=UPI0032675ED8